MTNFEKLCKGKKPDTKKHILYDTIYMKYPELAHLQGLKVDE
jgi:hypothetical protein